MKASTLIQILQNAGWREIRQQGDHRIFMHSVHPNLISIPDLGEKEMKMGPLNDIFREAGLRARVRKIHFRPLRLIADLIQAMKIQGNSN